jgi:SAM-dependent methyltransferase
MNIKEFFDLYWQKEEYRRWDDLRHAARSLKEKAYSSIDEFGMSQIAPSAMRSADFGDSESSFPAKGRMLEIGPGMGQDTPFLSRSGSELVAIDLSRESLKKIREQIPNPKFQIPIRLRRTQFPISESKISVTQQPNFQEENFQTNFNSPITNLHVLQMDATELGFKEESFDLLFANTVLMHLHRRKFFPEVKRILTEGGRAVFIEPLKNNPFLFLYRLFFSKSREIHPDYLSLEEIQKFSSFFQRVETSEFYLFAFLFFPLLHFSRMFKRRSNHVPDKRNRTFISSLFHLLERTDSTIIRLFPFTKRFSSFVVIECVK